jgi:hypothetical protein
MQADVRRARRRVHGPAPCRCDPWKPAGLGALVAIVGGCAAERPPSQAAPPPTEYVRLAALAGAHPAYPRLQRLEAQLIELRRLPALPCPRLPASPPEIPPARPVELPAEGLRIRPPAAMDANAAAERIREEHELARLAAPDPGPDVFLAEMDRLRRRYLDLRRELEPPRADASDLATREEAAARQRLNARLQELRRPDPRLQFDPTLASARRDELADVARQLAALDLRELERLRQALKSYRPPALTIPPAEIAKANQAARAATADHVRGLQRSLDLDLARLRDLAQPPPPAVTLSPVSLEELTAISELRKRVAAEVASRHAALRREPPAPRRAGEPTAREVGERIQRLRRAIDVDVRAAVLSLAREQGREIVFEPGRGVDRTAKYRSRLANLLASAQPGAAKR